MYLGMKWKVRYFSTICLYFVRNNIPGAYITIIFMNFCKKEYWTHLTSILVFYTLWTVLMLYWLLFIPRARSPYQGFEVGTWADCGRVAIARRAVGWALWQADSDVARAALGRYAGPCIGLQQWRVRRPSAAPWDPVRTRTASGASRRGLCKRNRWLTD